MISTIVSTLPFKLVEPKPGLIPYEYIIEAAVNNGISITHVDDAYFLRIIPLSSESTPPIKSIVLGEQVAESIISDFTGALICVNLTPNEDGSVSKPGLFWTPGLLMEKEVRVKCPDQINQAFKNTKAWFSSLVKMADDDWARTHQYKAISDLQRRACKYLNLSREWNFDIFTAQSNSCWACKASIHPEALLCSKCGAILNAAEYAKRKDSFVKV